MHSFFARSLDELTQWRAQIDRRLIELGKLLSAQDLLSDADAATLTTLRERLATDKLVLAFVAEFSRGKSELINALFFSNTGRRVLPATPGRTTMCPVELRWESGMQPRLALLPIETRARGLSLAELRLREDFWQHVPLDPKQPQTLVQALAAVTRTQRVSIEQAGKLGFWDPERPDDNPTVGSDGQVEVPAWRHALIHYPHPLLERGLVVIDTPGLNAIGAEPELTLGLLPTAHAVVFVLAADTGVTRSDLSIWREHLGSSSLERYVVLNKIDTLLDPLATPEQVRQQIEQQREETAQTLEVGLDRVFALSARDALAARVTGDADMSEVSRLPALERTLAEELLPRRQQLLVQAVAGAVQQVRNGTARRLADRRRQIAEQLIELRGLRGKSGGKLRTMLERVDAEVVEFERCTARLAALRTVQMRMLRTTLTPLASEALRSEVAAMQSAIAAKPLALGAKKAFETLLGRLRASIALAQEQVGEMRQMIEGSFRQLNTDFGFALALAPEPQLGAYAEELDLIGENYSRYLGLTQSWRLANAGFAEQFRRMLLSKLRVVFENAASEIELWSKGSSGQVEVQLRERRRAFVRRRDALQRVQAATGELESRIAEVQGQDEHLQRVLSQLDRLAEDVLVLTREAQDAEPPAAQPVRDAA
jgi:Dynamin family